jgi:hypothetical protein
MIIPASSKHSPWLWRGVVALLLVVGLLPGTTSTSTWANPPDGTPTPQTLPVHVEEPFYFQLEKPPSGSTAPAAAASVRPAAGGDWSALMNADFEGTFPPPGWEVQGEANWGQSGQSYSGIYSAGVEGFDGAPFAWLIYGGANGFSLDDLADAKLNFSYWLDTDAGAYFGWAASADGVGFYGGRTSGRVGAWLSGSLDLKHLVGDGSVWIAFALSGDGDGSDQNVFVDDVTLMVQEPYRLYLPVGFKNYVAPFPDFHDDFSDTSSGWPRVHVNKLPKYEEHRDYSNEYGSTYRMRLGGYTWFHRIFASPADVFTRDEFTLQTNMMYDYGDYRAGWGLVFEASDDMATYYMAGMYRYGGGSGIFCQIRRTVGGTETDLVKVSAPGYFKRSKGQWITIRVVRQENSISLYAFNPFGGWERILSTSNAPPLSGDRIGFTIFNSELGADAWFDNLHLWQGPLVP